jgi:hypothetical protein
MVLQIQCQAIGSEVAAETSRSAEMNAPAKTVAVWRTDENDVNIGNPFSFFSDPPSGRAMINARGVPIQESRYFSVYEPIGRRAFIGKFAASWLFSPPCWPKSFNNLSGNGQTLHV